MEKCKIPDNWGEDEILAKNEFGYTRDQYLESLKRIEEYISWDGKDIPLFGRACGVATGQYIAKETRKKNALSPWKIKDTESWLRILLPSIFQEAQRIGRKINTPILENMQDFLPDCCDRMESAGIPEHMDIPVPANQLIACLMIIFRGKCRPDNLYKAVVTGLASGYSKTIAKVEYTRNSASHFVSSEMEQIDNRYIFVNNFIFESDNTSLLIKAGLYLNPLLECSALILNDAKNDKTIGKEMITHRRYREICALQGNEKDILDAGKRLLDGVSAHHDPELETALSKQASAELIKIETRRLHGLVSQVWEKPFEINIHNLRNFKPLTGNYRNFIPPDGYADLRNKVMEILGPSFELSTHFFTEMDETIDALLKLADNPAKGQEYF